MKDRIAVVKFVFHIVKSQGYYLMLGPFLFLGIFINVFAVLYGNKEQVLVLMPGLLLYLCLLNQGLVTEIVLRHKGIRVMPDIKQLESHGKLGSINAVFVVYTMIIFTMSGIASICRAEYPWTLSLLSYFLCYFAGMLLASLGGKAILLQILLGYGGFVVVFTTLCRHGLQFNIELHPAVLCAMILFCLVGGNGFANLLSRISYKSDTRKGSNAL